MKKNVSPELTCAVIDALGGTAAVARICRIAAPSVSEWKKNGMSAAREDFFRAAYPKVFKRCERLLSIHEGEPASYVRLRMEGKPTPSR